jgi:hypothetical protein
MSRLRPFAASSMPAAGVLLGMRFKRASIPNPWIEALPGSAQFEPGLGRALVEPNASCPLSEPPACTS